MGLERGRIKTALLDMLYMVPHSLLMAQHGIRQANRIPRHIIHGVLLSRRHLNASALACLTRELARNRYRAYVTYSHMHKFEVQSQNYSLNQPIPFASKAFYGSSLVQLKCRAFMRNVYVFIYIVHSNLYIICTVIF